MCPPKPKTEEAYPTATEPFPEEMIFVVVAVPKSLLTTPPANEPKPDEFILYKLPVEVLTNEKEFVPVEEEHLEYNLTNAYLYRY